jgi:hypothetical protein
MRWSQSVVVAVAAGEAPSVDISKFLSSVSGAVIGKSAEVAAPEPGSGLFSGSRCLAPEKRRNQMSHSKISSRVALAFLIGEKHLNKSKKRRK